MTRRRESETAIETGTASATIDARREKTTTTEDERTEILAIIATGPTVPTETVVSENGTGIGIGVTDLEGTTEKETEIESEGETASVMMGTRIVEELHQAGPKFLEQAMPLDLPLPRGPSPFLSVSARGLPGIFRRPASRPLLLRKQK